MIKQANEENLDQKLRPKKDHMEVIRPSLQPKKKVLKSILVPSVVIL